MQKINVYCGDSPIAIIANGKCGIIYLSVVVDRNIKTCWMGRRVVTDEIWYDGSMHKLFIAFSKNTSISVSFEDQTFVDIVEGK